jgi:AcrR family transcriptional regulator
MEMPQKVKTRRKYYSPLRADQAEQTRRRILEASFRLFVDRGYAGTTIAAVAEKAGVSPETIYLSLGGKRGPLEGVIETAMPDTTTRRPPRTSGGPWLRSCSALAIGWRRWSSSGCVEPVWSRWRLLWQRSQLL